MSVSVEPGLAPIMAVVVTFERVKATPAATAVPPWAPVVVVVFAVSVLVAVSVKLCAPCRSASPATEADVVSLMMFSATEAPTPVESPVASSTFAFAVAEFVALEMAFSS